MFGNKNSTKNTKATVGRTIGQPKETHPSRTRQARKIVEDEIKSYYAPSVRGFGRSALDNMQVEAESAADPRYDATDWKKGARLVQAGCMAINYADEAVMLEKIYGKEKVKTWNDDKIHNTYKNLVGKTYAEMLSERKRKRAAKAQQKAQTKAARSASKSGGRKRK